ncbi:MAG: response regulator transcription factor [Tidjanibacter sp.]|nr:response regulator transcription factor [Tidjanibacter sp.]
MKVLIIEDETAAALNLRSLLGHEFPEVEIMAMTESIVETAEWFATGGSPDLVFMDIHLADGNAFKIFERTEISCPIVFTTAYDQYALQAFRVNSIDYLLKPIKADDLRRAITKFERLSGAERTDYTEKVNRMAQSQAEQNGTQQNFLIHVRDKIVPLSKDDIAFFYTSQERVSVYTMSGENYPMMGSLETIMNRLPESEFFRANRQYIISRKAINDISVWFGSRLSVNLSVAIPEKIIISKARVPEFKVWLAGNKE